MSQERERPERPAERLSARARAVESSGIRKVFDLGATMRDPINFSIGQPDFAVPGPVLEAAKRALDEGWNRYTPTQGIAPLQEKIAHKLAAANGLRILPKDVLVTSGSSGAIFLVLAAILDPGDEIVIPDPCFSMYPQIAAFFGARVAFVDTYPDFQIDPARVQAAITSRTKAILLNSPNNPTGAVYPEDVLREVARIAERHGLLVISDEVYESFVYDGLEHFSIGRAHPDTLTINALSKSHAAPGWRIGYCAGPAPLVEKMKELQQYTFVCAPSFAQVAAMTALDLGPAPVVEEYQQRRDLIYGLLSQRFEVTRPSGAFYIMPRVDAVDATAFVERAIAHNVLIIPGSVFSSRRTHVRLSYATSRQQIVRGAEILLSLA